MPQHTQVPFSRHFAEVPQDLLGQLFLLRDLVKRTGQIAEELHYNRSLHRTMTLNPVEAERYQRLVEHLRNLEFLASPEQAPESISQTLDFLVRVLTRETDTAPSNLESHGPVPTS